ncbi:MAG: hypothetical protein HXS46_18195 [Theionarchaea archaeon]|nr:hypothetical protein [Theionarchaea archaeon]
MGYERMKESILIMMLGIGGFVLGYLVSFCIYVEVYGHIPFIVYLLLSSWITMFLGLSPVLIYVERTVRSLQIVALIAVCYAGTMEFALAATPPLDVALFGYLGSVYSQWAEFPVIRFFLNPTLMIFNTVLSLSFGGLVSLIGRISEKDALLICGILFSLLTISTGIPSALMLWDMRGEIIQIAIFGGSFSYLFSHFLVNSRKTSDESI